MARKILLVTALLVTGVHCRSESERAVADQPETAGPGSREERPVILFLGTSITAGLGLDVEQAFPSLIQAAIDSVGFAFRVVNAGESGGTSAGGARRIAWLLRQPVSVLVLELGANDGLRGRDVRAMKSNLQLIIDETKAKHPGARIVVAGMEAPPNMGVSYTTEFRQAFADLARENDALLIPFLLDGVAGIRELNQADGIHPTAQGHRVIAKNVWDVLGPLLARLN